MTNTYIETLRNIVNSSNQYVNIILHNKKYHNLLKFINDTTPLLQDKFYTLKTKIFWILNDIHEFPRCRVCGKEIKNKNVFRITHPEIYYYCSTKCKCNDPKVKQAYKINNQLKYGVGITNVFQLPDIQQKQKETLIKKYGVDHYSKTEKWKSQVINTSIKHFGTEYPNQSQIIKDKHVKTSLEKYGVKSPTQNEIIKKKINDGFVKKYGVIRATILEEIKQKIKVTKLNRYGDETFNNIEKIKQTSMEKYGIDNPGATYESISKAKRRLHYDNLSFSSAPELAYYIWLKDNNINFVFQPKNKTIIYTDELGVNHRYYPDFYIVDSNELHEIKGDNHFKNFDINEQMIWPGNRKKDYIARAKQQCMKENNVKIITNKDYLKYMKYCQEKFGKYTWYVQFKNIK